MINDIQKISISYLVPYEIGNFRNVLAFKSSIIESVQQQYALIHSKDNNSLYMCSTMEILYDDVMEFPDDHSIRDTYSEFVREYGQDVVDKCIARDNDKIKSKLADTMLFAIDQLYKENEMIVEFEGFREGWDNHMKWKSTSSIISLLYQAAQENFDIIDQCLVGKNNFIHIKKRR